MHTSKQWVDIEPILLLLWQQKVLSGYNDQPQWKVLEVQGVLE